MPLRCEQAFGGESQRLRQRVLYSKSVSALFQRTSPPAGPSRAAALSRQGHVANQPPTGPVNAEPSVLFGLSGLRPVQEIIVGKMGASILNRLRRGPGR